MARVIVSVKRHHRLLFRWCLYASLLPCYNSVAQSQTEIGLLISAGNRQHYSSNKGFEKALAPSLAFTINHNRNLKNEFMFRYGVVAGVMGYKLKVVMIDTLGGNGDITPFPEYSILFASAEFLFARKFTVLRRSLAIGGGAGMTIYGSTSPTSQYSVEVLMPDNVLVTLFDAQMSSPTTRFSALWKLVCYYALSPSISVSFEYVHHMKPVADGTYYFYHTPQQLSGQITVYQQELRFGLFYTLRNTSTRRN